MLIMQYRNGSGTNINLSTISLDSVSVSVLGVLSATGIHMADTGTALYVSSGDNKVTQFSISSPWDIASTISQVGGQVGVGTGVSPTPFTQNVFLSSDGTRMLVPDSNQQEITQYTLSTPHTISSYGSSVDYEIGENYTHCAWWSPNGTEMYVGQDIGIPGISVAQYTLSTANNIASATLSNYYTMSGVTGWSGLIRDVQLTPNGAYMYVHNDKNEIFEFELSTPFDVSSATLVTSSPNLNAIIGTVSRSVFVKPDRTGIYVLGNDGFIYKLI